MASRSPRWSRTWARSAPGRPPRWRSRYLHVHPHGDAPEVGDTSGPEIVFEATAPTPGRYLLFLDFQIDGEVRTAPLVIDTTTGVGDNGTGHSGGEHFDTESSTGEEHEEGAGHGH